MKIALYKSKKRLFNRLVSWWTRSAYSHCEIIFGSNSESGESYCASASHLDGGVRFKWMTLNQEHWDIVEVEADPTSAMVWFTLHEGAAYDFLGIVGCVLRFLPPSKDKWFCSSAIAAAMCWPEPWRVLPANLRNVADYQTIRRALEVVHG